MELKQYFQYSMDGTLYTVAIAIALFLFLVLGVTLVEYPRKRSLKSPMLMAPKVESFHPKLIVYNYLQKPISLSYYSPDGKKSRLLKNFIPPETNMPIEGNIEKGGRVQVRLQPSISSEPVHIYRDYLIVKDEFPLNLHVGMITTKKLHFTSPVIYGGLLEMRYINIHNRMDVPLELNDHIVVPPNSRVIYNGVITGNEGGGVGVGEVFTDKKGIFPQFEIEMPITDLYYGVISDKEVPFYQGDKYLWNGAI
jgi:hypothetical protein